MLTDRHWPEQRQEHEPGQARVFEADAQGQDLRHSRGLREQGQLDQLSPVDVGLLLCGGEGACMYIFIYVFLLVLAEKTRGLLGGRDILGLDEQDITQESPRNRNIHGLSPRETHRFNQRNNHIFNPRINQRTTQIFTPRTTHKKPQKRPQTCSRSGAPRPTRTQTPNPRETPAEPRHSRATRSPRPSSTTSSRTSRTPSRPRPSSSRPRRGCRTQ